MMPTLKPNPSRIILKWPHSVFPTERLVNDSRLSLTIKIRPTSIDLEEITTEATMSSTVTISPMVNLIISSLLNESRPTEFYNQAQNSDREIISQTPTNGESLSTLSPIQIISSSNFTNEYKSNMTTSTRRPTSNKRPIKVSEANSDELAALRPPGRPPMNDGEDWINQIHAITTPKPYDAKRDCGIRAMPREAKIVGGRDSQFGELPWSVLIRETSLLGLLVKTKCGGVLIDLKWVLTAAHCKPGVLGSLVVVIGQNDQAGRLSGSHDINSVPSVRLKPFVRKVKRMIIHRDYNPSNFDNDIALLELESPFQLQPHVVPICLPEKNEDFIGQAAMVAGWGKLSFGGPVPNILQIANLPVIGNKDCQEMYHNSGHMKIISDSFVCAGFPNGGRDSCEGDSGGPLQVRRNDSRWVLVGTVSHGIKCAEPNLPGIYIRTAAYLPWIKAVMFHQDQNKRYGHSLYSN